MDFSTPSSSSLGSSHPPRDAAAARLPRRPLLRARRHLRHRARGQDAGRRLRRRRRSPRSPARPGSGSLAGIAASGAAGAGPRPRLDHAQGQPDHLRRGDQLPRRRARPRSSARPGSAGRPARRSSRATQRFLPIDLPVRRRARATCRCSGRSTASLISGHNILVYVALPRGAGRPGGCSSAPASACACAPSARTRRAVDTAGISVVRLRYARRASSPASSAASPAPISRPRRPPASSSDMTAGKGFIALAALIFAKWRPCRRCCACLLFGFLEAIGIRFQGIAVAADRRGAGAVHAGAALHPDRHPPRRLRRQGDPAARPAACPTSRSAECRAVEIDPRPRRRRPGRASASCSAPGSGT